MGRSISLLTWQPGFGYSGTVQARSFARLRLRWLVVVVTGFLLAVAGQVAANKIHAALMRTEFSLSTLQTRQATAQQSQPQQVSTLAASVPSSIPNDFVQSLPARFDNDHLMAVIERARLDSGVVLASVQLGPRSQEAQQLSSADLSLSLKGAYPAIKSFLSDLSSRCPEITLSRLSLQRSSGAPEIDAVVSLRAWARPVAQGLSATLTSSR